MTHQDVYAVILAGGSGTRFWPKSRHLSPKQLCSIGSSDKSMLEITLERLDNYIPPSRRIIVTHKDQAAETKRLVGHLCETIIAEPMAKNTAPALALAALEISQRAGSKDAIMISLHADAIIKNNDLFLATLKQAADIALDNYLTLIGIKPDSPETGYGYLEQGAPLPTKPGFIVSSFKEKPDLQLAKEYLAAGHLYWNSGIFTWRVGLFLAELSKSVPTIEQTLGALLSESCHSYEQVDTDQLREAYQALPKISVDHAVLEASKVVAMAIGEFDWMDVGSWDALPKTFPVDENGNYINGHSLALDCKGSVIDTDGPLVACLGLKDTVVIAAKGAILVCPTDRAQEVKKIVDELRSRNELGYL